MARNPGADNDGVRPHIRQREKVRALRIRPRAQSGTRNFIVGGGADIVVGMVIPPYFTALNADDATPEWKTLLGFFGFLLTSGTCTVEWLFNEATVVATHALTTTPPGEFTLATPIELAHGDTLRPTISAASGAVDLACAAIIGTSPR